MSKQELVILAGNCYPISSATGAIAINFGKYLENKYHVRMIVIEQQGYSYNGESINGFGIYTISNWRLKWAQNAKNKRDRTRGVYRYINNISYQLARIVGRTQATFFSLNNNTWYIKKAYQKLEELNRIAKIDVVLTCAAPHEAHWAGRKFKKNHSNVKWVTYWGDLLANRLNKLNLFVPMKRLKELETELCKESDYILTTQENYNILAEEAECKKVRALPYTLNQTVLDSYVEADQDKPEKITILYMGAFYRDIRNPAFFLELFSRLKCDFQLLLYSAGNCEDIVSRYVNNSQGKILSKGLVTKNTLIKEVRRADVLVNIQNRLENSNPSKLLELISYGKPIIDFSYSDDICDTLKNYPLCMNVNMNGKYRDYLDEVSQFIADKAGLSITPDEIKAKYSQHLEENIKKIVIEAIEGD